MSQYFKNAREKINQVLVAELFKTEDLEKIINEAVSSASKFYENLPSLEREESRRVLGRFLYLMQGLLAGFRLLEKDMKKPNLPKGNYLIENLKGLKNLLNEDLERVIFHLELIESLIETKAKVKKSIDEYCAHRDYPLTSLASSKTTSKYRRIPQEIKNYIKERASELKEAAGLPEKEKLEFEKKWANKISGEISNRFNFELKYHPTIIGIALGNTPAEAREISREWYLRRKKYREERKMGEGYRNV